MISGCITVKVVSGYIAAKVNTTTPSTRSHAGVPSAGVVVIPDAVIICVCPMEGLPTIGETSMLPASNTCACSINGVSTTGLVVIPVADNT